MKTRVSSLVALALSLITTQSAIAHPLSRTGVDSSGGVGLMTDEVNPWFLGPEPIQYCVEVAKDFPLSKPQVQREIAQAFVKWQDVLNRYTQNDLSQIVKFGDGKAHTYTAVATEVPRCDHPTRQLSFKIGVQDRDVQHYFQTHSKDVLGYAHREAYDHQSFRTGGYIWLAPQNFLGLQPKTQRDEPDLQIFPDWTINDSVQSILLHEIGHVLGFQHRQGTVMAPDLFRRFLYYSRLLAYFGREKEEPRPKPFELSGMIEGPVSKFNVWNPARPIAFEDYSLARHILESEGVAFDLRTLMKSANLTLQFDSPHDAVTFNMDYAGVNYNYTARLISLNNTDQANEDCVKLYSKNIKGQPGYSVQNELPLLCAYPYALTYTGSITLNNGKIMTLTLQLDRNMMITMPNRYGSFTRFMGRSDNK